MSKRRNRSRLKSRAPRRQASPQAKAWAAGLAAMGNERWEEATIRLRDTLQRTKDAEIRRGTYYNLSYSYLEWGKYEEALALWARMEEAETDDPTHWYSLGVIYGCSGQLAKAIEAFKQYQRLMPARADRTAVDHLIEDLQQEQRGEVAPGSFLFNHLDAQLGTNLNLGEYELAEGKARQMVAIDSSRPEAYFVLGMALMDQQRLEEALVAFLQAYDLSPHNLPTLYSIGSCYFRLEQYAQAETWLERAYQEDDADLPTHELLGRVYEAQEQREKAVTFWRKALSVNPDYAPAQRALFAAGAGPKPKEPSSPHKKQLSKMIPLVKARMLQPRVYHSGTVTLMMDPQVGFVLEDKENILNRTVYAGAPFRAGEADETDILHFIGILKLLIKRMNKDNCRDLAVLVYYADGVQFNYTLKLEDGVLQDEGFGRLLADEAPMHLKVRVDSDLDSPYGMPFSGYFIYLAQEKAPGVIISTLGLAVE